MSDPYETVGPPPDGFGRLWTPHRMAYINGESKPADPGDVGQCPFCRIPGRSDSDGLIVARGDLVYVVLNLYPYSPGHLMVIPYRHVSEYPELRRAELVELAELTQTAITTITAVSGAPGFNIGINQGAVAGAGIGAHLHQHVVPRWAGDTNFIPIVAQTRVIPQLLGQTRDALAAAWPVR